MASKPLLSSPVLNREDVQSRLAAGDLMSRVIENDAAKHGRTPSPTPPDDTEATNVTTLQRRNEEAFDASGEASNAETPERPVEATPELADAPATIGPAVAAPTSETKSGLESRMALALERAQADDVAVVTVRAPQRLNTYIDRYVERVNRVRPKGKYRKQDAVAEMFAWFYASHPMPPAPEEEDL